MSDATIAFVVGRMNPPTPGHVKLIHDTITFAEEINANPLVYITLSHNFTKMTKTQRSKPIVGLADKKDDGTDLKPYVKHKSYENPLIPMMKKQLIQNMLFNKFGISHEESDGIIRIDPECNGIFKAMQCVKELQPDTDRIYFVMGKELDDKEREEREKLCLNKSDGRVIVQDEYGGRVRCHFVQRTRDEDVSGLSGSKVRLLAANGDYDKLYEVYGGYLTRPQVDELVRMILLGLNLNPDAESSVSANASVTAASSRKRPASASARGNQTKRARKAGGRKRVCRNTRVRRQRRTRKRMSA